eukprot:GILK01006915.1.p1 GENE.GILK01006915.1~~GILK01006915.1.p1  ORF type:complete len:955 (+),score=184.16 GILK01006915.1:253-2865(+)
MARWTIVLNVSNNTAGSTSGSGRMVTPIDSICLKSPFGSFLSCSVNGECITENTMHKVNCTWSIVKAGIPFLPEWNQARFFLTHDLWLLSRVHGESIRKVDLTTPEPSQTPTQDLSSLTLVEQESALMEDLLYVMMGLQGQYIRWFPLSKEAETLSPSCITLLTPSVSTNPYAATVSGSFRLHPQGVEQNPNNRTTTVNTRSNSTAVDGSLCELLSKLLPVCRSYRVVRVYIERHESFDYGEVCQALCAAMRQLCREYLVLVTQLEHQHRKGPGGLTLQKLWFYLQPALKTLGFLERIAQEAANRIGGDLLGVIYGVMNDSTDAHAKALGNHLLQRASVPFVSMLDAWIYQGVIEDPYQEFLVKEDSEIVLAMDKSDFSDTYWESRFTFRPNQVPVFLSAVADKVLTTGKYLSVFRACGRPISNPLVTQESDQVNPADSQWYTTKVEKAYSWASSHLLSLLMTEENLVARLCSLKNYFFLACGDFFVHLLDIAEDELTKTVQQITKSKLESLLEMALRTSTANVDPYKDDLTCELYPYTLIEQLFAIHSGQPLPTAAPAGTNSVLNSFLNIATPGTVSTSLPPSAHLKGLEAFTLSYTVTWPLSLVVSRRNLTKYQLLFRHLFFAKYVERQLSSTWLLHQSTKELRVHAAFAGSYCLRHRMLHLCKNLVYYMVVEVLEPNFHTMKSALNNATNIDEIISAHSNFLDMCLKECLLTDQELLKILTKITTTCLLFAQHVDRFTKSVKVDDAYMQAWDNYHAPEVGGIHRNELQRRQTRIEVESEHIGRVAQEKNYLRMIEKFSGNFDKHLKDFLERLKDQSKSRYDSHLTNLCTRLDYNSFYTDGLLKQQPQPNQQGVDSRPPTAPRGSAQR